jgi:predicted regulator of Ras-like GTPase activity (Roadblock/LC7/MglB family)
MDPCLTSLIVPKREVAAIESVLESLAHDSGAGCAMLLDRSGQVIAFRGAIEPDTVQALGALLAGTFASTREVALLLKEKDFRILLQQGAHENILTGTVGDRWILAVIFDERPRTGLVKVMVERVVDELCAVLKRVEESPVPDDNNVDDRFKAAAKAAVDRLFRD